VRSLRRLCDALTAVDTATLPLHSVHTLALFSPVALHEISVHSCTLLTDGAAHYMCCRWSLKELRSALYTLRDLKMCGFTLADMREAGFTAGQLIVRARSSPLCLPTQTAGRRHNPCMRACVAGVCCRAVGRHDAWWRACYMFKCRRFAH
jgi:hypothetical protein